MIVPFGQVTNHLLRSADLVVVVDPRDPDREVSLYPGPRPRAPRHATADTVRALVVVVDPRRRDEQVSELRNRLAFLWSPVGSWRGAPPGSDPAAG